jgi:hypothetical protein
MRAWRGVVLTVASLAAASGRASAERPPIEGKLAEEAHVQEALAQAGANRAELERLLREAYFADEPAEGSVVLLVPTGHAYEAARFLIANMPGKGHILTVLKDAKGTVVPYDPLAYPDYEAALQAYEALEKQHGTLEFARDRLVSDLETLKADFLLQHVMEAVAAWWATPAARRVSFDTFCRYVLPYRGSEEPAEAWMQALRRRYGAEPDGLKDAADPVAVWEFVQRDVASRIGFNERWYLHPTDQGFDEMGKTKQGRCEDITNLTTYSARALGLATAADYTPAWGHRDNNHAWNVLLDKDGRGADPAQAHAAKVYRKTFELQRANLAYLLPKDREAPNRFLASKSYLDVTEQYGPTSDVQVTLDAARVGSEAFAYLCVFNGGEWTAIHWTAPGRTSQGGWATFTNMGRGSNGMLYLPAVHDGKALRAVAAPLVLHKDGRVEAFPGTGPATALTAEAVSPEQVSADTFAKTPVQRLTVGVTYRLHVWTLDGWKQLAEVVAGAEPAVFQDVPSDGLFWLAPVESRRLERPFTLRDGRQRFW